MGFFDLTINPMTKCSTYIRNPITPQILLNIYQPLQKLVYQTYPPLKQYSKNNLRQSGYNKKLTYKPTDTNHQKHSKHKRKIKWFNSPLSKNVSKKIGKSFLILLDLHFPGSHIYSSIFSRNKIKVSYSCMQNTNFVINNHNMNKVLNNTAKIEESCNCRNKNNCPLDGKCLTPNIIYEPQIMSNQLNYKQKFTQEPPKQILNIGLTTNQNNSTLNTMKTTQNYLKNTGQ